MIFVEMHICNVTDLYFLQFNAIFGNAIHLGYFYLIFLLLVVVFCTNSINIYAGVNGLEVLFIYLFIYLNEK